MHKNRIELEGYLGHRPEARTMPSGLRVVNARLAEESYRYKDEKGTEQTRTTWHNVVLYGALASIAETFEKGENVRIVGALLSRDFTPKDGSKPRTVWEVVAREAYVIAPRRAGKGGAIGASAGAPKPAPSAAEGIVPAAPLEDALEDAGWV